MVTTIRLVEIDAPKCSAGAPMPVVVQDDANFVFGYYIQDDEPFTRAAICSIDTCLISSFGYPNDEALGGHRYYGLGLRWYQAYEVLNSEWIESIRTSNRTHPQHRDENFNSYRHFIFTFHDSTLEFIARDAPQLEIADGDPFTAVSRAFAQSAGG